MLVEEPLTRIEIDFDSQESNLMQLGQIWDKLIEAIDCVRKQQRIVEQKSWEIIGELSDSLMFLQASTQPEDVLQFRSEISHAVTAVMRSIIAALEGYGYDWKSRFNQAEINLMLQGEPTQK